MSGPSWHRSPPGQIRLWPPGGTIIGQCEKGAIDLRSDVTSPVPLVDSSFIFLIDFSKMVNKNTIAPRTKPTRVVTNHDNKHNIVI